MPQAAASPRPALSLRTVWAVPRWDCINARPRKKGQGEPVVASRSLLTSQCLRRPPRKPGLFGCGRGVHWWGRLGGGEGVRRTCFRWHSRPFKIL